MTTSRVTADFNDDKVARIDGGDLPTERDYLSRISGQPPRKSKTESPGPQPMPSSAADPQSSRHHRTTMTQMKIAVAGASGPHGPHADRSHPQRARRCRWPARSTSPARPASAPTPPLSSAS